MGCENVILCVFVILGDQDPSFTLTGDEGLIQFKRAFCKLDRSVKVLSCKCCEDKNKCLEVDEYRFYMMRNFPKGGYMISQGTLWSGSSLAMRIFDEYSPVTPKDSAPYLIQYKRGQPPIKLSPKKYVEIDANDGPNVKMVYSSLTDDDLELASFATYCDGIRNNGNHCWKISRGRQYSAYMCPVNVYTTPDGKKLGLGPKSCTNLIITQGKYSVPAIDFELPSDFKKPNIWDNAVQQYLIHHETGQGYRLVYEPVNSIIATHPDDETTFLLNFTLSRVTLQNTNIPGLNLNFDSQADWIQFEKAYCQIVRDDQGKQRVECVCCSKPGSSDVICAKGQTNSVIKVEFGGTVPDHGHIFMQFKLRLDSRNQFTLEGGELQKGFDDKFRLSFEWSRGTDSEKKYCYSWENCAFNFARRISADDAIKINVELLNKDDMPIQNTLLFVDDFKIGSGPKIQPKGDTCVRNDQAGRVSCFCPENKDFDGKCHDIAPLPCRQLTLNDRQVNGKVQKQAAFKLKVFADPTPSKHMYAKMNPDYYTFSYEQNGDSVNDYKIQIGPATSGSAFSKVTTNTIQLNFDVADNLVIFSNVECTINEAKTEWMCNCCESGKCPDDPPFVHPEHTTSTSTTTFTPDTETEAPFDSNKDPCDSPSGETAKLCQILEKGEINSTNFDNYVEETKKAMSQNTSSAADLIIVSKIFDEMANVKDATWKQRMNSLSLVDQVLAIKWESFIESKRSTSDKYLDALHRLLSESPDDIIYLDGNNLGAQKTTLTCTGDDKQWPGIVDNSKSFQLSNSDQNSGSLAASIELSQGHLCQNQAKGSNNSVYFVIYRNGKLFYQPQDSEEKENNEFTSLFSNFVQKLSASESSNESKDVKVNRCKKQYHPTNGFVLTSVVWNGNASNQIQAKLRFKKGQFDLSSHSNLAVTWWDKTGWAQNRQCKFKLEGDEYVAYCDHLTNFALLVEKSSTDPLLCDIVLDRLGFWLSVVSLTALFVLILIYSTRLLPVAKDSTFLRILNNQRRAGNDTYIILYTAVMLAFYLIFLVFVDQSLTNSALVCKFTAAFLYYLFLSAMLLNIFQAWDMIKMCAWTSQVEAILQMLTRFFVVIPVSLGLPFLTCLILWFVDTGFFFRGDQFCWIRPQSVVFAILIPVTLMLINSFATFIIFCVRMFPGFFKKFGVRRASVRLAKAQKRERRMNLELFVAIIFAQFILGFPWILQYPAMFSSNATVWHYLFAIFNGTNGLILFIMYAYGRILAFCRIRQVNPNTTTTSDNSEAERKVSCQSEGSGQTDEDF